MNMVQTSSMLFKKAYEDPKEQERALKRPRRHLETTKKEDLDFIPSKSAKNP